MAASLTFNWRCFVDQLVTKPALKNRARLYLTRLRKIKAFHQHTRIKSLAVLKGQYLITGKHDSLKVFRHIFCGQVQNQQWLTVTKALYSALRPCDGVLNT